MRLSKLILWVLLILGMIATSGPALYYAVVRLKEFSLDHPQNLLLSDRKKLQLSRLGQAQMLGLDVWDHRDDVRVLTLRQAEFGFYSKVRFISHIDPRMVSFYSANTVEEAFFELRRLGITHVSIPEEPLPTLYNSFLEEITNSGRFVRRRDQFGGAVLCELLDQPMPPSQTSARSMSAGSEWTPWSAENKYAIQADSHANNGRTTSLFNSPSISVNAREVRLSSGPGPIDVSPELTGIADPLKLEFGHEYLLDIDISGEGLVLTEVHLYVGDTPRKVVPVWQGFLSGRSKPLRAVFTQDLVSPKCVGCRTATARVVVRLLSRGQVHIGDTSIRESGFVGRSSSIERALAERRGWALIAPQSQAIRWGLTSRRELPVLFLRHSGAYPASLESFAFPVRESVVAPSLSFQARGYGRFFAELRCARDEGPAAQEISPETGWLARFLSPGAGAMPSIRNGLDDTAAVDAAVVYAAEDWKELSVRLRLPDCPALAHQAVVSRRLPISESEHAAFPQSGLYRLAFVTRRETDYAGRMEELPQVQIRSISLDISPLTDAREFVRL